MALWGSGVRIPSAPPSFRPQTLIKAAEALITRLHRAKPFHIVATTPPVPIVLQPPEVNVFGRRHFLSDEAAMYKLEELTVTCMAAMRVLIRSRERSTFLADAGAWVPSRDRAL